jgi:hypothetical protein
LAASAPAVLAGAAITATIEKERIDVDQQPQISRRNPAPPH